MFATHLLAALLLATAITACAAPAALVEPVTLDFAAPETALEYWQPFLDDFREAHPNITVNVEHDPDDETDVALLSSFAWEEAMGEDRLLSLDVFIEEDASFERDDFPAGALALFAHDGKQWCIPFEADAFVMYYNKDLFDRAGVPYPKPGWTWDDFLAAAQAIRDPNAGIYGYLSPHSSQQRADPLLFMLTGGAEQFLEVETPEEARALPLDDPDTVEAVTFWADLMFRHNVAPTEEQLADELGSGLEGELAAKQQGKAGMWMDWYGARNEVEGLLRDRQRWGVTTIPAGRREGTYAIGRGLCVAADAADPEATWQLVSFLSRQPPETGFPVRRSVVASKDNVRRAGEEAAAVAAASMEDAVLIGPSLPPSDEVIRRLFYAFNSIADGRATVTEALSGE